MSCFKNFQKQGECLKIIPGRALLTKPDQFTIEKNKAWVLINYKLKYERRPGKEDTVCGEFSLKLSENPTDENNAAAAALRNKTELELWCRKGTIDLILLYYLLEDAIAFVDWLDEKHRLVILLSFLAFLEDPPISSKRFKTSLWDLAGRYFSLTFDEKANEDELLLHKKQAVQRYLQLCFDDSSQQWFEEHQILKEVAVDNAVKKAFKILSDIDKGDSSSKDWPKGPPLLEKCQMWLISRYNLFLASKLAFHKKILLRLCYLLLPELVAGCIVFWLFFGPFRLSPNNEKNIPLGVFYGLMCLGGCSLLLTRKKKDKGKKGDLPRLNSIQLMLPRLAAGIVVGYFFLLADEAWRGIFSNSLVFLRYPPAKPDWWLVSGRIFLPLLAVLVYIFIEMRNVPGVKVAWKPFVLLLRGYSYSIITGLFISDIFGRSMSAGKSVGSFYQGFLGTIYPEVILYLAPLALFIGVFLQLLWEDKTLTAKI